MNVPKDIPFRDVFSDALRDYQDCQTYWYVPKARVLSDENVVACAQTLYVIFEEFLGEIWSHQTQDALLSRMIEIGIQNPTASTASIESRTALPRITKVLLGTKLLGLVSCG